MPSQSPHAGADNCTAPKTLSKKTFFRPSLIALSIIFAVLLALRFLPLRNFFQSEEERFVQFTEEVFRSEMRGSTLNLHYTIADPDTYQVNSSDVTLGDASLKARQQSCAVLENYLDTLNTFNYEELSPKRQLTYDVFSHYLETELSAATLLLYDEPLSPTLGVQAQLPILLAEYTFRTKGDIEDYLCLLTRIPDYFSSVLAFERDKSEAGLFMSSDCAVEVIRQCREFINDPENNYLIEIFNEKIDAIQNLSTDEKTAYKTRNRSILEGYVIPAYETLISGIGALEGSGVNNKGLYWLPEGKSYYQYLVKSKVGDDRSIEEIEEDIKAQMVADYTAIQELARQYLGSQSDDAGQSDDALSSEYSDAADMAVISSAVSSDSGNTTTDSESSARKPVVMLEDLRRKITTDFPLLPEVSYQVKYVHSSLQEYLSPAFYLTPAIDDYKSNVIYINPASNYNDLELYTTLAHEGYPGHLYQSVYFNTQDPDLLRCLLDVGGYTEGWATYVEMYSYSLWEEDTALASLGQRNRSFTLGLASLLDIGIHYRGYSLAEVTSFLEQLGFESSTAESLYQSILQAPANYLQYYVGYLNFSSLRDTAKEQLQDRFSLKDFHQFILETGPAPFSILQQQINIYFS